MSYSLQDKDTVNKDMFQVSVVEKTTAPENTDFYNSFWSVEKVTFILGWFGQLLSAITEFILVYRAAVGFGATWEFAAVCGLSVVYIYEWLGIRKYLVSVVRQATNRDFDTWQKITLFCFNVFFCLVILTANVVTSIGGHSTTFKSEKNERSKNAHIIEKLNNELINSIDSANKKHEIIKKDLEKEAAEKEEKIIAKYDQEIKGFEASKWAVGASISGFNKKINKSNGKKIEEINEINDTLKVYVSANTALMNSIIKTARSSHKVRIEELKNDTNSSVSIVAILDDATLILLLLFMSLSIISIIYSQIFMSGSGVKSEVKEVKKRPLLIMALLWGLYYKVYHLGYKLVCYIVGDQAYNYSKILMRKDDYTSFDATQNTGLIPFFKSILSSIKGSIKGPPQTPQIGFSANTAKTVKPPAVQEIMKNKGYKVNTITSWFRRSDLVENPENPGPKGQKNNRIKYIKAKEDLTPLGVQFIEDKKNNTVTIIM